MAIDFQISRDPQQLQQYYRLRERCFRTELGIGDFDGAEDDHDRSGDILLALRDGRCIGGARISPNVTLHSQLGQLQIDPVQCCIWERFVVDPAERSVEMIRDFCGELVEASRVNGFSYAMVLSSLRNARFYRRCHSALGVDYRIHRAVPHCARGKFAGLEHYLSISYLGDCNRLRMAG